MKIVGSQIISHSPDGTALAKVFEIEINDESVKKIIQIASSELMLDSGVGELLAAAENVLRFRGQIVDYPPVTGIEKTERIPQSSLDKLEWSIRKVRDIVARASDVGNQRTF